MDHRNNISDSTFPSASFYNYRSKDDGDLTTTYHDEKLLSQNELSTGDSAYSSGYNLTPYSTPNVSSNLSGASFNLSKTPRRSSLNVIPECYSDSIKLTPVTLNARRISEFHITTPKTDNNATSETCLTSKKRPLLFEEKFQTTPKKFKSEIFEIISANSTPIKQKHPKSTKNILQKKSQSSRNLDEFFNDTENIFEYNSIKTTPKSDLKRKPLAVCTNFNQSTPKLKLEEKLNLNRPGSVESDSIIKLFRCSSEEFNLIVKPNNKDASEYKTEKPNKFSLENKDFYQDDEIVESSRNLPITKVPRCNIESSAMKMPFRRVLTFTTKSDLLSSSSENDTPTYTSSDTSTVNEKTPTSPRGFFQEDSFRKYKSQYPIINTVLNDRIIAKRKANAARQHEESPIKQSNMPPNSKNLYVEKSSVQIFTPSQENSNFSQCMEKTPTLNSELSNVKIFNSDMIISPYVTNFKPCGIMKKVNLDNCDVIPIECETDDENYIPITPPRHQTPSYVDDFINPLDNHSSADNLYLERTPKKTSVSTIPCSDQEKFEILYPKIPVTPHKQYVKDNDSPKRMSPSSKRKHIKGARKKCYNGALHLNIIGKLDAYSVVLNEIFDYLSDLDLLHLSMVSKSYRTIMKGNYKANLRIHYFISKYKTGKENYKHKNVQEIEQNVANLNEKSIKSKPFSNYNVRLDRKRSYELINKSPPVSPSKRKFYEHQKLVKSLSDKQTISKCPRCGTPSRSVNVPPIQLDQLEFDEYNNNNSNDAFRLPSTSIPNKNNNNLEDKNIDFVSLQSSSDLRRSSLKIQRTRQANAKLIKAFSVDSMYGQLRKNLLLKEIDTFQPYGECTRTDCKFKFCLNCLCDYHPNVKCQSTYSVSPTKQDIEDGILQVSKSPKKIYKGSRSVYMRKKSLKRLCFD